jgi:general stress protein YciG
MVPGKGMDKSVSIVKVDHRPYRVIAQENWGLTKEQMQGKHVHHRIHRSKGGTNDPSNLYVCSPWYHDVIWHNGSGGFIELAREAGIEGGKLGAEAVHKEKDENGKSKHAVKMGKASDATLTPEEKSKRGRKGGKKGAATLNASLTPEQKRENGRKGGKAYAASTTPEQRKEIARKGGTKSAPITNAQRWQSTIDGFISTAGSVARHNKANGWDPSARVRVYPPDPEV